MDLIDSKGVYSVVWFDFERKFQPNTTNQLAYTTNQSV